MRPHEPAPANSGDNAPASPVAQDKPVVTQSRTSVGALSRWAVHLALLFTIAVALVPLLLFGFNPRVTIHIAIACAFFGLVIIHLGQRRHTLAKLIAQLARTGSLLKAPRRLAVSDAIFILLAANVLASGIYDLATGQNTRIPIPGIQLFIGWHTLSSLLFLIYLITHVIRRRKRLRRSRIR